MSSLPATQTQRFQDKREALLHAATRQFNEHGVKGATLAGIAASVGLVTNSVTYYYRKKEDLAAACFLHAAGVFNQVADLAMAAPTIEGRLHTFFRQLAQILAAVERGEHAPLVMFNDLRSLPSPHFETVTHAYAVLFRKLRSLLQGPQTAGLTRSDMSVRAYGLLSHSLWLRAWINLHAVVAYEDVAARACDMLLHGSMSANEAWPPHSETERRWQLRPVVEPTQEAFLRAASQLINEQGYRGASVDKIARMLNVTKGSFYHHNETKEDVAWACFERTFAVVQRALDLANREFGCGWERACAASRVLSRFQLSAEGPLLRMAGITAVAEPARREEALRIMGQLSLRQSSILVDGMVDGSIRPIDPNIGGHIGTGIVSSTSVLRHWVKSATADNVCELYVRPMMMGIFCPSSGVP